MQKKSLIIIGAGISGLSLSWYLRKKYPQKEITLVDAKPKIGGMIETVDEEFFFERGPRTFQSNKSVDFLNLIDELGLKDDVIYATPKKRFIYMENELHPLPHNPWQILRSRLTKGIFSGLVKDLLTKPRPLEDESVYDFFKRHLGEPLTLQLIDPVFTGIYAGDIHKLSILSTMPKLKEWEHQHGSLIKASWKARKNKKGTPRLFTLKKGLEHFCKTLFEKSEVDFVPGFSVDTVMRQNDRIIVKSGEKILSADHVCSTVILPGKLSSIHRKSLSVVNVAYRDPISIPEGFGYLIPSKEKEKVKGVIFDSKVFPEQSRTPEETRLTVIMDAADGAETIALDALRRHLSITITPAYLAVKQYPQAIVQPQVHHKEKIKAMLPRWENITWLGTHLYGVAINDCVLAAKNAAEKL